MDYFLALASKKGLDISLLTNIHVIKKPSSYGSMSEEFGKAKIDWVDSLLNFNHRDGKKIFIICDKDNAEINFHNNGVSVLVNNRTIDKYKNKRIFRNIDLHLLAWKRREVKNYLLSFSAVA